METVFQGARVVAHRGSRLLWPENTTLAFEGAATFGVGFYETDLRVTADGELVCFHDPTVDRTTNGQGLVARLTLGELRALDAGYRHAQEGAFPFRARGEVIPTFIEVLERFPVAGFVVDLKADGTEEPLARLVAERELHSRLIVGSFSDQRLARFRELTTNRVGTSTGFDESMRAIAAAFAARRWNPFATATVAMQVPVSWYGFPVVTGRLVSLAHRFDRLFHVWTINETGEMQRLFELGVDAVITDRPDLAIQVKVGR